MLASLFLAGAEGLEPSARGFGVDVGKCSKEQGRAGVARFLPQVRKGAVLVWCWEEIIRAKTGEKEREIPGKAGNTLTEIDNVRIIKNAGETRRASVAGRRLATPFTLLQHREGVMRMGNNRGAKALRFVVCLAIVLALAIVFAPKAC